MADSKKKPLPSRWECANCGLPEQPGVALRPCSRCKLVRYCGIECQAQHWKKGGHKKHCVAPEQRKPQPAAKEEGDGGAGPTCAICIEAMVGNDSVELSCSHKFHRRCMAEMESNSTARACPVCRSDIAPDSPLNRASKVNQRDDKVDQVTDQPFSTNFSGQLGYMCVGLYSGGWLAGQPHGEGRFKETEGGRRDYQGGWRNGHHYGHGTLTFSRGDHAGNKYVGMWENDRRHGQGTFTAANGDMYVGAFQNAKFNAQGIYTWANGDKYVGAWVNSERHGQGALTCADGKKYVGAWKNDNMHGQGTFTRASIHKYVGAFQDGEIHGQGTVTFADGSKCANHKTAPMNPLS